jgi:hypothetical protein
MTAIFNLERDKALVLGNSTAAPATQNEKLRKDNW